MITETRESARGNQPVTNEVTNQLPKRWSDDPWCNMTTGEAEAWRKGWEAAKAKAIQEAQNSFDAADNVHRRMALSIVLRNLEAMGPTKTKDVFSSTITQEAK